MIRNVFLFQFIYKFTNRDIYKSVSCRKIDIRFGGAVPVKYEDLIQTTEKVSWNLETTPVERFIRHDVRNLLFRPGVGGLLYDKGLYTEHVEWRYETRREKVHTKSVNLHNRIFDTLMFAEKHIDNVTFEEMSISSITPYGLLIDDTVFQRPVSDINRTLITYMDVYVYEHDAIAPRCCKTLAHCTEVGYGYIGSMRQFTRDGLK